MTDTGFLIYSAVMFGAGLAAGLAIGIWWMWGAVRAYRFKLERFAGERGAAVESAGASTGKGGVCCELN